MLIALSTAPLSTSLFGELARAEWAQGSRLFHAARLVAALLVVTVVPILIDRRLRR
jgi:hypothetical protein